MRFARPHLETEFKLVHPALIYVVIASDAHIRKHSLEILITHVYRTERQQREFYPNSTQRSPHQDWRAVDGVFYSTSHNRVCTPPRDVVDELVRLCALLVPKQKSMPVALWEETSTSTMASTGPHMHWQIQHNIEETFAI